MKKSSKKPKPFELSCFKPVLEFTGDEHVLVEGSTGVVRYENELIKLNTRSMAICFYGRGLRLTCISPTAVIIEGCITKTEFVR